MSSYDSEPDTRAHINRVRELLEIIGNHLLSRAVIHDATKLAPPEKEMFDSATQALRGMTYGSDEYRAALKELKPALDHHYAHNSHHPEHYPWHCPICKWQGNNAQHETAPQGPNDTGVRYCPKCCAAGMIYESELMLKPELGVNGMTLLDLVEMFVDWKAATERHADGSLERSIKHNRERFAMSGQLSQIFENTRREMNW